MADDESAKTGSLGLLVFLLSSLVAVFLGPLEAVLAIALYWSYESGSGDAATR